MSTNVAIEDVPQAIIYRVPDDILFLIFSDVVEPAIDARASPFQSDAGPTNGDLLAISYVCSRWRQLAVGAPSLWTDIVILRIEHARLFLARSLKMPIRVFIPWQLPASHPLQSYILTLLKPHLHRLRSFHVTRRAAGDRNNDLMGWVARLPAPAPLLEDLVLKSRPLSANAAGEPAVADAMIPNLRSLTLQHVKYPTASPLFRTLRHLHIAFLDWRAGITSLSLLAALGQCPQLEALNVHDVEALEDGITDAMLPDPPVSLPALVALEIQRTKPVKFIANLSLHLALPHIVRCRFGTFDLQAWRSDVHFTFPRLERLEYTVSSSQCLPRAHTIASVRAFAEGAPDAVLAVELEHWGADDGDLGDLGPVDVAHVRTLVLATDAAVFRPKADGGRLAGTWRKTLERMPALETLRVCRSVSGLCNMFAALAEMRGSALRTLELDELSIRAETASAFWRALLEMVERRRAMGVPLEVVRMRKFNGQVDDSVALKLGSLLEELCITVGDPHR